MQNIPIQRVNISKSMALHAIFFIRTSKFVRAWDCPMHLLKTLAKSEPRCSYKKYRVGFATASKFESQLHVCRSNKQFVHLSKRLKTRSGPVVVYSVNKMRTDNMVF